MLSFLNKYAKNYRHSQNGEEGVILECWKRLNGLESDLSAEIVPQDGRMSLRDAETGRAVEIGGNDGLYCSNTALLAEHGWETLFVEGNYSLYLKSKNNWADRHHVRHQCCRVDENNVNAFVDNRCDVLSLDTDGGDYKLFEAMKAKPKVVIVEIDSSIEPPSEELNLDGACGYWPMTKLGIEKGYFLLCHTGNLILVDNQYRDLFPEIVSDGLSNSELYFKRDWVPVKDAA